MVQIKERRLIKLGNGYGFTIPKDYVKNGILELGKNYQIIIEEVQDGQGNAAL